MWKILILTTANYISVTFVTHPYNIQSYLLLRVIVACTTFCLAEPRLDKNPWNEGPVDFIIASGYDPVPVDDKLLPSHKDEKVKREEFSTRHSFNLFRVSTTVQSSPTMITRSRSSSNQFSNSRTFPAQTTRLTISK